MNADTRRYWNLKTSLVTWASSPCCVCESSEKFDLAKSQRTEHGLEAHVTTTPFTGKLLSVCLGGLGASGFDELNRVAVVFLFPASVPA